MGFLDKAKAAATELSAKADQAMSQAGINTPGATSSTSASAERLLRDLGVIAYLEATDETPGYGGSGLGNLGPVSEGLFAWLVGIGGLVGFAIWIAAHTTRSTRTKPTSETGASA